MTTKTINGICKDCQNELTEDDIKKLGHRRPGYCLSCNRKHERISVQKRNDTLKTDMKILNKVHLGNNLRLMMYMENESVDLIYLDPPYYTQTTWKNGNNEFSDNWKDIDEYLNFMKVRFEQMRRILKSTGSIYLHVDHHAVFELKPIMDKVFGRNNFINDIVWTYNGRETKQQRFPHKHDTILIYSKSKDYTFNTLYKPYRTEYIKSFFKNDDKDGKGKYQTQPDGKGGRYKQYLNKCKGQIINDVWDDIKPLNNFGRQHNLKYPTQKPIELLERIVKASSNENDIILDPFCGSGTTLEAAKNLGRKYIGLDKNKQAVKISIERTPKGVTDDWRG